MHTALSYLGIGFSHLALWWYSFWSGIGSDLGEFTIFGTMLAVLRRINCHHDGCWRIGHHPIEGTPFTVCRKHHPDIDHTQPIRTV